MIDLQNTKFYFLFIFFLSFCLGKNAVSIPAATSNEVLRIVSDKVGHCWKKLARELNLREGRIDMISVEENDHQERCHKALQRWCEENGEGATIRKLMLALNKTRLVDVNKDVLYFLKETGPTV